MYIRETQPLTTYETKQMQIANAALSVFIADTAEKRTQGLMNITSLSEDIGMLFVFSDAAPRTFWNKNTYIDLDIIWIHEDRVVGISHLPAIPKSGTIGTVSSPGNARFVLEVNAGWAERQGIGVGSKVQVD